MGTARRRRLLVAVLVVGLLPWGGVAVGQDDEAQQLSRTRAALARIGDEVATAERLADDASTALGDAQAVLDRVESIVNELAAEVEHQRVAVGDARIRLHEVESERRLLQEAFEARIAQRYMQGPELTFELLLAADEVEEAVARSVLLERLLEGDSVDLERLAAARVAVAARQRALEAEQAQLTELLDEQQVALSEAEQLRDSRSLAAVAAADEARRLATQQDDLESEEQRLAALLQRRQEEERQRREAMARAGTTASAPSTSGYAWPLCAPVTSGYGPRWGRMHRGVDQGAPSGTPIGASRDGTVIHAGWQGGYGQLVIVDHGGGMATAYAHMSRIEVASGSRVQRGDRLGRVGSTGNSTGPHLHFEIRANGTAVNPRQYLPASPC